MNGKWSFEVNGALANPNITPRPTLRILITSLQFWKLVIIFLSNIREAFCDLNQLSCFCFLNVGTCAALILFFHEARWIYSLTCSNLNIPRHHAHVINITFGPKTKFWTWALLKANLSMGRCKVWGGEHECKQCVPIKESSMFLLAVNKEITLKTWGVQSRQLFDTNICLSNLAVRAYWPRTIIFTFKVMQGF